MASGNLPVRHTNPQMQSNVPKIRSQAQSMNPAQNVLNQSGALQQNLFGPNPMTVQASSQNAQAARQPSGDMFSDMFSDMPSAVQPKLENATSGNQMMVTLGRPMTTVSSTNIAFQSVPGGILPTFQGTSQQGQLQNNPTVAAKVKRTIWHGLLEYCETPNQPKSQRISHTLSCTVTNAELNVNVDKWPNRLVLQFIPRQLFDSTHLDNHLQTATRFVRINFDQKSEALSKLCNKMSPGLFGFVEFPNSCDIKVMFVIYVADKEAFMGFIANDQEGFWNMIKLKNENHQKTQQQKQGMQQQQLLRNAMPSSDNLVIPYSNAANPNMMTNQMDATSETNATDSKATDSEATDSDFEGECLNVMMDVPPSDEASPPPDDSQLCVLEEIPQVTITTINGVRCRYVHLMHPDFLKPDYVSSSDYQTSSSEKEEQPETKEQEVEPKGNVSPKKSHRHRSGSSSSRRNLSPRRSRKNRSQSPRRKDRSKRKVKHSHEKRSDSSSSSQDRKSRSESRNSGKSSTKFKTSSQVVDLSSDDDYMKSLKNYSNQRKKREKSSSENDEAESRHREIEKEEFFYEEYPDEYFCDVCQKNMNSFLMWKSHINGKKHLKAVKLANPAKVAKESAEAALGVASIDLKGLHAPTGYERIKTSEKSQIQDLVDQISPPIHGLNKVLEIVDENNVVTYLCELCDAPCVPHTIIAHLKGFKHLLNCLKEYDPEHYEKFKRCKKHVIEDKIQRLLNSMNIRERNFIQVVKDRVKPTSSRYLALSSSMAGPSTSFASESKDLQSYNIPDSSKGDLYCKLCDSHMNSKNMWIAHINGKRHLKNEKKAPGELPSKVKYLKVDQRARLMDRLSTLDLIVGLDYMQEKHNESGGELYTCHLCSACCTSFDVIEHIMTSKHRRKYLERAAPQRATTISEMGPSLKNVGTDSLIDDACHELFLSFGPGKMDVYVPKRYL